MTFRLPELPANLQSTYGAAAVAAVGILVTARLFRGPNLDAIPTVGSDSWLGSWWDGLTFPVNADRIVRQGFEKYKSDPFKIADLYDWVVVLSNRKHVDEVLRLSDDESSFITAFLDQFNFDAIMGHGFFDNPTHNGFIRAQLTRNMGALFPAITDEIAFAFNEVLGIKGNEWKRVPSASSIRKVVCKSGNRMFVGMPLCRDPEWINMILQFSMDIFMGGAIVGLFPKFLRPLAGCLFPGITRNIARGAKLLGPMLDERRKSLKEHGKEADLPQDGVTWCLQDAQDAELTPTLLSAKLLALNLTAIHSTTNILTHALLYLAANPQYVHVLREEVEAVVQKEGWTKVGLAKMRKVDSFFKECERIEGMVTAGLRRRIKKDVTLSDGTFLPKGTTTAIGIQVVHRDGDTYPNASAFEPFRFTEGHRDDEEDAKHQLASTAVDYLVFGHGKHACPGRFFAAAHLKLMFAHAVVTYDIKLDDVDGAASCTRGLNTGTMLMADPRTSLLFRKRAH